MMLPSRQEFRSMLLTTLWECDQVLLLKWNHDGELELIADEQGEPCDQRAGVTRLPPCGR